ncbi:MAG: winged helix-turn-helix domain-containing protein [Chloroflexi bacterium]|nr:winged helix-turn-helix domain-containing protein [Chloroflexota bacterium]
MTQREDVPVLIAQSGALAGQRWALVEDQLLIGRGPDCDVRVDDRQVSRHHARVKRGAGGIDPPLSVPQYRLLEMLYDHAGKVCTREQVVKVVWPEAAGAGVSEQAIDALVRRLRDRLAEADAHEFVVTVRGHGFRLDNPAL